MTELKIARIEVFQVDLPHSGGVYHLSGGRTYTSFDGTIVRITTQNGIQGWGESTPFGSKFIASHALGVRAGIAEIAPHLIGLDPRNVDHINDAMNAALLGNKTAKAAIDVTCWDVFGKSVGLPVCQLLVGGTGDKLPLLLSVPVADAEDTRQLVADVRAQGCKEFSVKIGQDPESDAERIKAALADKKRDEHFTIDANSGLTVENALRTLRLLPEGLDFVLEAPCATWRETISLRRRTSIPFLIDELLLNEAAAAEIVASDAGEEINLKVSKVGGLTRCRRICDTCLASGITISVQETCGSDISFAAITHLSQTIPSHMLRPILHSNQMVIPKTADCAFEIHDGFVEAPNTPGLGVTPRLDVLGEPVATYQ
ncbi:MR-MLE domain-containing protein [Fusarium sp. Ph1]|nr:MR-MLE domain-containing protein [Fusarium sp. Ph1]